MKVAGKIISAFLSLLLLIILNHGTAHAQQPGTAALTEGEVVHDEAQVKLLAGNYAQDSNGNTILNLGAKFELADGWKTYWRTPGDGGLPAAFSWGGAKNTGEIHNLWPAPKRYIDFDTIENFAYKHTVILPIIAQVKDPSKPVKINTSVSYAVCKEICVFFNDKLSLEIPAGENNEENQKLIDEYAALVPAANGTHGLTIENQNTISRENEKWGMLEIKARSESGFGSPDLIIESHPNFRFPKPDITLSSDKTIATFKTKYEITIPGNTLAQKPLTLTLIDGKKSVERTTKTGEVVTQDIWGILLLAFIGGLILNVMPCVLPVLSIKLLSVIQHGGRSNFKIRLSFASSVAGIIASFLVLAWVIILIKASGNIIGWGFHFQEPVFLLTMAIVTTLFAANLWGVFEIAMPEFVNEIVPKEKEHSLLGHFLSGAMATLLATPCSAPFVGTAIGFAFTQGQQEILLTFGAMGTGLAAPYLLFVIFPQAVSALPKPGAWMLKVKYTLGVFLALTTLWLIWVVEGSMGTASALALLILCTAMVFGLLAVKRAQKWHKSMFVSVVVLVSAVIYYLPTNLASKTESRVEHSQIWQQFSKQKIKEYVADGKVVFVDVTADWCLTCKANKLLVLDHDDIKERLAAEDIIAMEADWTKPNQDIALYLEDFNRHGIPFNIVYGPGAPMGIVLPELLTKTIVLNAINQARGR